MRRRQLGLIARTVNAHPIEVSARFREIDTPVMLGASMLLLFLLFAMRSIRRICGVLMMAAFADYMVFSNGMSA